MKINEQFSNKAKEFISGGKTTAGTRVNEDTAQQASLPLCPRLQLLYEKVLVHEQVSDTSVITETQAPRGSCLEAIAP